MRVTIAMDSFKGSLNSVEAAEAVKRGILRIYPEAVIHIRPVADGGEGTVDALIAGMNGQRISLQATGPLGNQIECSYGVLRDNITAVIEMSSAAGLTLISEEERNPMNTTTYGVGEMIADAIGRGYRKFLIGIGGSATNDGGVGMLQALGYEFLNKDGQAVALGAKGLSELSEIRTDRVIPELSKCFFKIACDVKNPLCGENGCSAVYGPQKGADGEMVRMMDSWLDSYAKLAGTIFFNADQTYPGTGAAGGLGFAFLTFMNSVLEPGIEMILQETGMEELVKEADLVITGEGRLDGQTVMGKTPIGVARLAKKYEKPVIAFAGCVTEEARSCNQAGIDAFFPILRNAVSLEEAMDSTNASGNLEAAAEQVFSLIKALGDIQLLKMCIQE